VPSQLAFIMVDATPLGKALAVALARALSLLYVHTYVRGRMGGEGREGKGILRKNFVRKSGRAEESLPRLYFRGEGPSLGRVSRLDVKHSSRFRK